MDTNSIQSSEGSSPYFASSSPQQNIPPTDPPSSSSSTSSNKRPNLTALAVRRQQRRKQPQQQQHDEDLLPPPIIPPADRIIADDDNAIVDSPLLWQRLDRLEQRLNSALATRRFPARIAAVYNPTVYARRLHCAYLERFLANRRPAVVFVGMNPGPWGMCQTGVPFGCVPAVRDWMRLDGELDGRPPGELAAYPVRGMQCERVEVSGTRLWAVMRQVFGDAERFFAHCFVHNLCPLALFAEHRNVTPAELKLGPLEGRDVLERMCAAALLEFLDWCGPTVRVVSVGHYVDRVLRKAYRLRGGKNDAGGGDCRPAELLCMPHPSPRAARNASWETKAREWLQEHGIGPAAATTTVQVE